MIWLRFRKKDMKLTSKMTVRHNMHIDDLSNVYRNVCLLETFILINYKGESCFGFLFQFVIDFVLLLLLSL